MKIEVRKLSKDEFYRLLEEAPEHETRNLLDYMIENNYDAYNFFERKGIDHFGMLEDGRPMYFASLVVSDDGMKEFWTVVNKNIKNMVSMCKVCKRELKKWFEKYGTFYAMMNKDLELNKKWTEWLGFRKLDEDKDLVYYSYEGV